MGIRCDQLREYVVRPVLKDLDLWSLAAENLLLGTAAQESQMGTYLHQVNGPACGIYQIEPQTHADVWTSYLRFRPELSAKVIQYGKAGVLANLTYSLAYATAIARIIYYRYSDELPAATDVPGLAALYKKRYNTYDGKASVQQFIDNYNKYIF